MKPGSNSERNKNTVLSWRKLTVALLLYRMPSTVSPSWTCVIAVLASLRRLNLHCDSGSERLLLLLLALSRVLPQLLHWLVSFIVTTFIKSLQMLSHDYPGGLRNLRTACHTPSRAALRLLESRISGSACQITAQGPRSNASYWQEYSNCCQLFHMSLPSDSTRLLPSLTLAPLLPPLIH